MFDRLMSLTEAPRPKKPPPPPPPQPKRDEDHPKVKKQRAKAQQRRQKRKATKRETSAEKLAAKKQRAQEKARKTREKKAKAARAKAAAENKAKRKARQAALKKKTDKRDASGTKDKASPSGKAPKDMVGAQLRHCMLALKYKRKKSTKAAWNICRWSLTKYGYMKGPYRVNTKLPKATKMTSKGVRRSFQHGMEKGPLNKGIPGTGATKARKFDKLFKSIEKDVIRKSG
jgi:hypothetical protein